MGQLQSKTYRTKLVRRVYINNGGKRPLGIPTTSDKVIQHAAATILQTIYEQEFSPHSYGDTVPIPEHNKRSKTLRGS